MALFGSSPSPREGATETTTATLDPEGTLRFPAAPLWLAEAAHVEYRHFEDDLFGIEPTFAGEEDTHGDDEGEGVAFEVTEPLREYGLEPDSLPQALELRVAYDPDARRVLLDVDALFDVLVGRIEAGDATISTCPWC